MAKILRLRAVSRRPLIRGGSPLVDALLTSALSLVLILCGCARQAPQSRSGAIDRAHAAMAEGVPVDGEGVVVKILGDDTRGSRHQRFIVRIPSGLTLLIAHNTDVGRRVPLNGPGDTVRFRGEYEWNNKGGVVHWTHHDPRGRHRGGWIELEGTRYD